MGRGKTNILVRTALLGLFLLALVIKLRDPETLLVPLRSGLGLANHAAAVVFILTVTGLAVCVGTLLLKRGAGLIVSGLFFACGAAYAVMLSKGGWTGDCGCGVVTVVEASDPMIAHAYQNTACAVLCLFLGFRVQPGGGSDETKALDR
jgi:hypothetical protein